MQSGACEQGPSTEYLALISSTLNARKYFDNAYKHQYALKRYWILATSITFVRLKHLMK